MTGSAIAPLKNFQALCRKCNIVCMRRSCLPGLGDDLFRRTTIELYLPLFCCAVTLAVSPKQAQKST